MNRNCPYCGAPLPEETAFCPNCAQSVNERTQLKPPRPILGKFLRIGIPLLVLCAAALSIFLYTRPRTYDSGDTGQVIYSDRDGSYQLLLNQAQDRYKLMPGKEQAAELDGEYRTSIQLYINRAEDGSDATEEFMAKVEDVTAEVVQVADDCPPPWTCPCPCPLSATTSLMPPWSAFWISSAVMGPGSCCGPSP